MSLVDEFADFVGNVPYRKTELPWGAAQVWDVGEGSPVVLMHGIAGGRRLFYRLVPLLARTHRVIVPPLRGEDIPSTARTPDVYLDDLAALLDSLELSGATLLGISFGAYLTLGYAARGDPRVTRTIVQGGFSRFRLRVADRATLWASYLLPASAGSAYFKRRVLKGTEGVLLRERAPGLDALVADWMGKTPFATVRARTRMIGDHAHAGRIEAPLSIAHGRLDPVVPFGSFERLRKLYPDAQATAWDDAGHNVALTHPERLAALLTADR